MWVLIICSSLQLLYAHARIFWLPLDYGGGSIKTLSTYAVGYSAILFGLIMLISLSGDRWTNFYGCRIPKIALPFIYLGMSQAIAPNADMVGHISGIIAAVILKYLGFYQIRLLP